MQGELSDTTPRPGALNTLGRVREEMGRVYRDMRTGRIPVGDGTRLFYALNILLRAIEYGDLEERLIALEQTQLINRSSSNETLTTKN